MVIRAYRMGNRALLLGLVVFLPFATEVIAQYGLSRPTVVLYGLTLTGVSIAYFVLQRQEAHAHPTASQAVTRWNIVGLTLYPLATVLGYFVPVLGVAMIGPIALFYGMPRNVRSATIRP